MAKAIHTMIRVLDIDRSIDFYNKAFGLKIVDRFDFNDFELVYLRNPENDFEVESTLNKGWTTPYSHGDGFGHIAVCVESCRSERATGRRASGWSREKSRNSSATIS
jgi:lactoylglutathione lyase